MIKKLAILSILVLLLNACSTTQESVVESDCGCYGTSSYTIRKPVEVIYKDVTYKTIYEPRTYITTTYVKKPYNKCDEDLCN